MKIISDAKMVDIKIIEVPYTWKNHVSSLELGSTENIEYIHLIHKPSGTKFSVLVDKNISDCSKIAESRAKAKIIFIHNLRDETWLLDDTLYS